MLLVYTAPPIEGQPQRAVVSIGREVQLDDCNWNNTECDVCCRRFLIKPFTIAVLFFLFYCGSDGAKCRPSSSCLMFYLTYFSHLYNGIHSGLSLRNFSFVLYSFPAVKK